MIIWFIILCIHRKRKNIRGNFWGKLKDERIMDGVHLSADFLTLVLKPLDLSFEFHALLAHQARLAFPDGARLNLPVDGARLKRGRSALTAQNHNEP
jgi:hypothetical protein